MHFISTVHLCNCYVTLYYPTTKMGFAQYCVGSKRRRPPGLGEFTVLEGKWYRRSGRGKV